MKVETTQIYPICDLIHKYEIVKDQVKEHFVNFIVDKSIPLNDRWTIFVNAPDELKDQHSWIYHWVTKVFDDGVMYDGSIKWVEKYETVYMKDVFERISEMEESELVELGVTEEIISTEKEKILSLNVGSYRYYW